MSTKLHSYAKPEDSPEEWNFLIILTGNVKCAVWINSLHAFQIVVDWHHYTWPWKAEPYVKPGK